MARSHAPHSRAASLAALHSRAAAAREARAPAHRSASRAVRRPAPASASPELQAAPAVRLAFSRRRKRDRPPRAARRPGRREKAPAQRGMGALRRPPERTYAATVVKAGDRRYWTLVQRLLATGAPAGTGG